MSRITDYQLVNSPDPGDVLLIDGTNGTRIIPVEKVGIGLDATLTQTGKAADAKETGDKLRKLQSDVYTCGDILKLKENIPIEIEIEGTRYINASSGALGTVATGESFSHTDYVNVRLFKELTYKRITTSASTPAFGLAFYDESKVYISGVKAVGGSSDLGYVIAKVTVPENAVYARFTTLNDTTSYGEFSVYEENPLINEYAKNSVYYNNLWEYGEITYGFAVAGNNGTLTINNAYDTTDFIPVTEGDIIFGYGARFFCYDSEKHAISGKTGVLNNLSTSLFNGMHYYKIPAGASYFRICAQKDHSSNYQFVLYLTSPFERNNVPQDNRILYALGDSITRGMYAEIGTSASSGPTEYNYPYYIAMANNYTLVNLGNSGSGWANVGSAETAGDPSTARNAKDVVDDNTFEDADIITMAWGVNDWKGATQDVILGSMDSISGDGTVIGNMKYCIENLVLKKPTAQLIVLLPMNTNRQWTGMDTMTEENNWAFGYGYRYNQTLDDYRTAIKTCAEYYNVKVIDLEEVCPINRLNIRQVLGDGLHPTKAFHKQMGQALAPYIH